MERILSQLGGILDDLVRYEVVQLGPVSITSTVVNTWIVIAVIMGFVFLVRRAGFNTVPRGAQALVEILVEFVYGLMDEPLGKEGRRFLWIPGSLIVFIFFLNVAWFIPDFVPPTTDVMTPMALAVTTILIVQVMGFREKGLKGYIGNFTQPVALMLPMNLISELIKPFSLTLRLFGNMFGEKMVVTILGLLVPVFLPVPVMLLGLLMGAIQAFIFTLLSVNYLADQTQDG